MITQTLKWRQVPYDKQNTKADFALKKFAKPKDFEIDLW